MQRMVVTCCMMRSIALLIILFITAELELSASEGIVDFPLTGPYSVGPYQAELKVGDPYPSKPYKLQVDTGSDITWIRCNDSYSLTYTLDPPWPWNVYRLDHSYTVSILTCGHKLCGSTYPTSGKCTNPDEPCPYSVTYADGRGSSGYYIMDIAHLKMKGPESFSFQSNAYLVFGCATELRGHFDTDGVLGLGHEGASILNQLKVQGKFTGVFSHCLKGEEVQGRRGFLMLGPLEAIPDMSCTPLDISQFFYKVQIENIMVDGKKLPVDQRAFVNSKQHGTTVDPGTNLISLVPQVYNPVIAAISNAVNLSWSEGGYQNLYCYSLSIIKSLMQTFPTISLNMKGDGSILLRPQDYLIRNDTDHACLGIVKSRDGFNSLGGIVLKDKLIVYDLNNKTLGWSSYNCSVVPNTTLKFPAPSIACTYGKGVHRMLITFVAIVFIIASP